MSSWAGNEIHIVNPSCSKMKIICEAHASWSGNEININTRKKTHILNTHTHTHGLPGTAIISHARPNKRKRRRASTSSNCATNSNSITEGKRRERGTCLAGGEEEKERGGGDSKKRAMFGAPNFPQIKKKIRCRYLTKALPTPAFIQSRSSVRGGR